MGRSTLAMQAAAWPSLAPALLVMVCGRHAPATAALAPGVWRGTDLQPARRARPVVRIDEAVDSLAVLGSLSLSRGLWLPRSCHRHAYPWRAVWLGPPSCEESAVGNRLIQPVEPGAGARTTTCQHWAAFVMLLPSWQHTRMQLELQSEHKNAIGVAVGASLGHTVCTSLAVVEGSILASKILHRTVATIGGVLLWFSVSSYFYPPL